MELTTEQLNDIERYAAAMLTVAQIAAVIRTDKYDLAEAIRDDNSEAGQAFIRGQIKTILPLHNELITNATEGSPTAQAELLKLIEKQISSTKI